MKVIFYLNQNRALCLKFYCPITLKILINIKYNILCVWYISILYEQLKLFFTVEC
jgi:hypothetical protein